MLLRVIPASLCLLLAASLHAQVTFVVTGPSGTTTYKTDGDPHSSTGGKCTEITPDGGEVERTWVRDGDDIVIQSSPGSERARLKNGAVQGEGSGTQGAGESVKWKNINFD